MYKPQKKQGRPKQDGPIFCFFFYKDDWYFPSKLGFKLQGKTPVS